MVPYSRALAVGISLRELFPEAEFVGAGDVRATSCTADWRACRPGDLFVALAGRESDGHDHVKRALARGAAAVLAERMLPVFDRPQCIVENTREAFGRLCQELMGNPSSRLKVIGVTGTQGKTTTTRLIANVLRAADQEVGTHDAHGSFDGCDWSPAADGTPTTPELAAWLARAEAAGCSHAVMEVSSRALAESRLAGIEFDAACVTNVRRADLNFHNSVANYRLAKGRIFEQLSATGVVVLNADDPVCAGYLCQVSNPALTVGMKDLGEIKGTVIERYSSEQTFLLTAGSDTVPVRTRLPGDDNVYNCLIAATVGLVYGIDLATVVRGLESVDEPEPPVTTAIARIPLSPQALLAA